MKIRRIVFFTIIILVIVSLFSNVLGANNEYVLNVIEKSSEIKYLENNQGYVSKSIIESDSENGEVTIELKLSNIKKESTETKVYDNTEIFVLVSENLANNSDKLDQYSQYIERLVNNITQRNSNTKIGIIGIKGTISDSTINDDGTLSIGENDEGDVAGTEKNTEIVANFSRDVEELKSKLKQMNPEKTKYKTNLQAAIRLANKSYSQETNKILISLYDGVPDIAIGVKSMVEHGGTTGYNTAEEAVIGKHKKIVEYTRNDILNLKKSNISFIQLRPDDTSYDETWYNSKTGEKILDFDGSPYVKELYGTIDNPVYGKMYSLNDANLETIITQYIYEDIIKIIQTDINAVKIVDYFPEDITKNFDFSYVEEPTIGEVSDTIDPETKSITWNIEKLEGDTTATLRYKLKIKNINDTSLLNKIISTNEKVVLTYKDPDSREYTVTLDTSPKIKLTAKEMEEQPENPGNNEEKELPEEPKDITNKITNDPTVAPVRIPQTGASYFIITVMGIVGIIALISFIKNKQYKDIE